MIKLIYNSFYGMNFDTVISAMFFLSGVWSVASRLLQGKKLQVYWKITNIFLLFIITMVIISVTLISRGNTREVCLIPLYSFKLARKQPEIYRSMLMNVFLFFPLGLSLPFALPEKWKHQVLWSILFAMLLSIGIEFSQYYYHLGRAEVDDVLCNTLGCAVGCTSYLLYRRLLLTKNESHMKI